MPELCRYLTGYLMLDTQHVGKAVPSRLTHWEIHPEQLSRCVPEALVDAKQEVGGPI